MTVTVYNNPSSIVSLMPRSEKCLQYESLNAICGMIAREKFQVDSHYFKVYLFIKTQ